MKKIFLVALTLLAAACAPMRNPAANLDETTPTARKVPAAAPTQQQAKPQAPQPTAETR